MIYTVTFNPSLDYIVSVDRFLPGAVNRTSRELIFPGGKGINVSIVLKNLGFDSRALGFTGGFTGNEITRLLQGKGIFTDFIRASEGASRINVKLRSDRETEINGQGPRISRQELLQLYDKLDNLSGDDILVLAGSIPSSLPSSIYMDIMKRLSGRHVKIVVDATGELLKNVLPLEPFLVKPNHLELGELFGMKLHAKDEVAFYAKKLQELGAKNVLVSMAGDGAVLVTEDGQEYLADAPKGDVVNSVGAGDSMVAGFLTGYLASDSFREAFLYGLCTGSASAFSEGLATEEAVRDLLHNNPNLIH